MRSEKPNLVPNQPTQCNNQSYTLTPFIGVRRLCTTSRALCVRTSEPRVKNSPIPDEVKPNWTDPRKEDSQQPRHAAADGGGNRTGRKQKPAANHRNENEKRQRYNKETEPHPDTFWYDPAIANNNVAQGHCSRPKQRLLQR